MSSAGEWTVEPGSGSVAYGEPVDVSPDALAAAVAGLRFSATAALTTDTEFSAGDVRSLTGLSYRQLNDWEGRGAVPADAERGAGWRRYSEPDMFVLLVCAELRKRFGVPVERIAEVKEFLTRPGRNYFEDAAQMIRVLGSGVWFVTDFEGTFVVSSDIQLAELWANGLFNGSPEALVMLKLNPLVNRLLKRHEEPIELAEHGAGLRLVEQARGRDNVFMDPEIKLLEMIRSGDYDRVEVVCPDGKISRFNSTSKSPVDADLLKLVQDHPFQTLTLVTRAGKVVSIGHQVTTDA